MNFTLKARKSFSKYQRSCQETKVFLLGKGLGVEVIFLVHFRVFNEVLIVVKRKLSTCWSQSLPSESQLDFCIFFAFRVWPWGLKLNLLSQPYFGQVQRADEQVPKADIIGVGVKMD